MKLLRQVDRLWWLVVPVVAAVLFIWFWRTSGDHFSYLGNMKNSERSGLYSALAGVSSGLLGFSFAAIAILIAVPKGQSPRFSAARGQTVSLLLSTCALIGSSLTLSIVGMIVDRGSVAPVWLASSLVSTMITSFVGLAICGVSLACLLRAVA